MAFVSAIERALNVRPQDRPQKEPNNPRVLCGSRTRFSLYRCMKVECEQSKYFDHAECKYLRAWDEVRALPP